MSTFESITVSSIEIIAPAVGSRRFARDILSNRELLTRPWWDMPKLSKKMEEKLSAIAKERGWRSE